MEIFDSSCEGLKYYEIEWKIKTIRIFLEIYETVVSRWKNGKKIQTHYPVQGPKFENQEMHDWKKIYILFDFIKNTACMCLAIERILWLHARFHFRET